MDIVIAVLVGGGIGLVVSVMYAVSVMYLLNMVQRHALDLKRQQKEITLLSWDLAILKRAPRGGLTDRLREKREPHFGARR